MNRRICRAIVAGGVIAASAAMTLPPVYATPGASVAVSPSLVSSPPTPDPDATVTKTLAYCAGPNIAAFTAADFSRVLGVNSQVAKRAAEIAPDLRRVDQLLAVSGIGPTELAAIKRAHPDLCALPPTIPPTPKDICVFNSQYDLNNLDEVDERAAVAKALTLSLNEVKRMDALGPFSSVQVALAVLGLGDGSYKKIMVGAPPPLCVTPPGFVTASGQTYGWISSALNDQLVADGFSLTVAASTLTKPGGSWASIDRDDVKLGYNVPDVAQATIDLVDDSWEDGSKKIWVSVPADKTPTVPGAVVEQKVFHQRQDGTLEIFDADRILSSGDQVTVASTSNNVFTSSIGFVWEAWRWVRGRSTGSPSCSPTAPAGSSHVGEMLSNSPGGLIGECTYANSNVPGAIGAIDRVRADMAVDYLPVSRVQISNPGFGDDLMPSLVAQFWPVPGYHASFGSNTNLYLPPSAPYWSGDTLIVPASDGVYRITPNLLVTGVGITLDKVYETALKKVVDSLKSTLVTAGLPQDKADKVGNDAIGSLIECAYTMYRDAPQDPEGLLKAGYDFFRVCLRDVFERAVISVTAGFDTDLGLDTTAAKNTLLRLGFSGKLGVFTSGAVDILANNQYAILSQIATSLVDIARAYAKDDSVRLSTPAARPSQLPSGESIPSACVRSDGQGGYWVDRSCVLPPQPPAGSGGSTTYIVNVEQDPLAFLVRDGVNVGEFASGGDYICAAQSFPVRFVKDRSYAAVYGTSSNELRCPSDVSGPARNILSYDQVLLRMADGTTYFKNGATLTGLEHVLDGGCFEQLAAGHYGFDYVTTEEIQAQLKDGWELDDSSAACQ